MKYPFVRGGPSAFVSVRYQKYELLSRLFMRRSQTVHSCLNGESGHWLWMKTLDKILGCSVALPSVCGCAHRHIRPLGGTDTDTVADTDTGGSSKARFRRYSPWSDVTQFEYSFISYDSKFMRGKSQANVLQASLDALLYRCTISLSVFVSASDLYLSVAATFVFALAIKTRVCVCVRTRLFTF